MKVRRSNGGQCGWALTFLLYKAEELPSYLRPHVAHRLVVCESQRLRSHEHRDAKHHQKYNFIQIHFYK